MLSSLSGPENKAELEEFRVTAKKELQKLHEKMLQK
jgi:hypothetical protein